MKFTSRLFTIASLTLILAINACTVPPVTQTKLTATPFQPELLESQTSSTEIVNLFFDENTPKGWVDIVDAFEEVALVDKIEEADYSLLPSLGKTDENALASFDLVYAAVMPFFTVEDEISFDTLSQLWHESTGEDKDRNIFVAKKTRELLASVWGQPGDNVYTGKPAELLELVKASPSALAIIPFEDIVPQWKVLKIGGLSPLDRPFQSEQYPLVVSFNLISNGGKKPDANGFVSDFSTAIPASNREDSKMTVVVMSGTTAITRGLAYKVTINDTEYPVALVKDWFLTADFRHVSNESPFYEDCPSPDPYTASLVFCTSPDMIEVLENIGINVVELTGNHIKDYLDESLLYSLQLYRDRGWSFYAAGENAQEARKPVLIEHNGNRIAFIGCNAVGPASVWADENKVGAALCDFDYLDQTIRELKSDGYTVITTFQHEELSQQDGAAAVRMFGEEISDDFRAMAEAGADIVQGSQAHYPMGFEFVGNSLIHYGLGNFLFDQMWDPNRDEFIDRHIIYDGKYINTELLTAVLMDWSQPTPMDDEQRAQFLDEIFTVSKVREE